MGSCFSKNTKNNASSSTALKHKQHCPSNDEEEIETVKEVLSLQHTGTTSTVEDDSVMKIDKESSSVVVVVEDEKSAQAETLIEIENVLTTTSVPEKKLDHDNDDGDGDGEMKLREKLDTSSHHGKLMRNRSHPNDFTLKRDKVVIGKFPVRTTEMSPARKSEDRSESKILTTELRLGSRGNTSVGRSNSSAGRLNVGKVGGSVMKRSSSTGRVMMSNLPEKKRNDGDRKLSGGGSNESFENPLVSLECFIFL